MKAAPVWLITGCSTGFGRELAMQALARGHSVAVTARNLGQVRALADHPMRSRCSWTSPMRRR